MKKVLCAFLPLLLLVLLAAPASADIIGSIFLTGHDPDFHATVGGNTAGAQNIIQTGVGFVMDPGFNAFVAGGIGKFLFVQSNITPPGGHVNGVPALVASGFVAGTDFEQHGASTGLGAELNLLGTKYSAIVVASDFGGILTQAELDILNARSADILQFLNNGGGIFAMAESDSGAGLTPGGGLYGYLPFVVTSTVFNRAETGNTVTPFGASLGLTDTDINGNFSHNVFTATGGLAAVDLDPSRNMISIAGRGQVTPGGIVPEPSSLLLLGTVMSGIGLLIRKRRA